MILAEPHTEADDYFIFETADEELDPSGVFTVNVYRSESTADTLGTRLNSLFFFELDRDGTLVSGLTGNGDNEPAGTDKFIILDKKSQKMTTGGSSTLSYTLSDPTNTKTNILFEVEAQINLTVGSFEGDIAQDLSGSSLPAVVTNPVAPGEATTVTVAVDALPEIDEQELVVIANATISVDGY